MFVYVITCLVNGKRYVGKANMPAQRWAAHQTVARTGKGQTPLYVEMREFGLEAFAFEVVEQCESEEQSFDAERRWIRKLRSDDREVGYNLTSGGQGLTGCSDASRQKMSAAKRGIPQPTEHVARRAESIRTNGKKVQLLARVLELHKQGLNQYQIAEQVGRTQARVNQLLKEAGIRAESHQGRKYSQSENETALQEALRMRSQGLSYEVIARAIGRSASTVHTLLREHLGLNAVS